MNRWVLSGLCMLSLALTAAGCCDKQEAQIKTLESDKAKLEGQVRGIQTELNQYKEHEGSLLSQVQQKDQEIANLRAEMDKNKGAKPAVASKGGDLPAGAEVIMSKAVVEGDVLFAAGRATLTEAGKAELSKIIRDVKGQQAGTIVRVYGHTDSDPIVKTKNLWQDNLDLSANRAMEVTRFMIANGVEARRIETIAMGEYHPVDAGKGADNKKKNRRVEIMVVKKG